MDTGSFFLFFFISILKIRKKEIQACMFFDRIRQNRPKGGQNDESFYYGRKT